MIRRLFLLIPILIYSVLARSEPPQLSTKLTCERQLSAPQRVPFRLTLVPVEGAREGWKTSQVSELEIENSIRHNPLNSDLENRLEHVHINTVETQMRGFKLNYFAAFDGTKIIGLAKLEEDYFTPGLFWVMLVSVDADYQRQGVGIAVLREVYRFADANKFRLHGSPYTIQGAKSLPGVHARLKLEFPNVTYMPPM